MKIQIILVCLAIFISACKKHDDTTQGPYEIRLDYKIFHPYQLEVPLGTTVIFTNNDGSAHTLIGNLFNSGSIQPQETFTYTFTKSGTNYFSCGYHSQNSNEQVSIRVQ